MFAAWLNRLSISSAPPFIAAVRSFVAQAFSVGPAGLMYPSVRSSQLWDVAGSLWGRPHFSYDLVGKEAACFADADSVR
jgi:hypothetical protein